MPIKSKQLHRHLRRVYLLMINLASRAQVNRKPIIVLGNQKSGTSIIASLSGAALKKSVCIDIRGIYEPELGRLAKGNRSFEDFVQRNRIDFSKDIVKEPFLTFFYDDLRLLFPLARFVLVIRNPFDNLRSILNRLGVNVFSGSINNEIVASWSQEWQAIVENRYFRESASHGIVSDYADWWNLIAQLYMRNKKEITLFLYKNFLKDKSGQIHDLCQNLGETDMKDISGLVDRQAQPKGNTSVKPCEFFDKVSLDVVIKKCGPLFYEIYGVKLETIVG